jgi:polar amino acid transport system substrate-binding protein
MKKIISLLMAILMIATLSLTLTSCSYKDDVRFVKEAGKLVVGVTVYKPMDYVDDKTGEWTGFDAELAKMFAESLGVTCEFFEIADWNNKVADINTKNIDLIWNGMTASEELGTKIDFSTAYAKNAQVVVVKKGATLTKDGLANAVIAVENGSAGADVVDDIIKPATVNKLPKQLDALYEVLSGNSDAAVIDLTMAQSVLGQGDYADLVLLEGAQYGEEVFAVGLRQGSDLKAKLDAFLAEKYADGTLAALSAKYGNSVVLNDAAFKK